MFLSINTCLSSLCTVNFTLLKLRHQLKDLWTELPIRSSAL